MNISNHDLPLCCIKAAGEKHRLPYSAKAQKELTDFIKTQLFGAEKKALALFKLPNIKQVELYLSGKIKDEPGPVEINEMHRQGLHDIVAEVQLAIIGDDRVKKIFNAKTTGKWGTSMFSVFSGHVGSVFDRIKRLFTGDKDKFEHRRYDPLFNDDMFQNILGQGINRIKKKLYLDNYKDCIEEMIQGVMANKTPLKIAEILHGRFGGALWQWESIVTSEITLVMNESFKIQAKMAGVNYEVWSAAAGACDICSALDGKKWKINEGPEPVTSTHPRCACYKYGIFLPGETPIQERWTRIPPYGSGNGWTREEIDNLPNLFL